MIQNSQRIIDRIRRYIQDPAGVQQGTTFTDQDLLDLANEEQEHLVAMMVEGSEDYFAVQTDYAFQAGVNVYPLFDGCLFLRKLDYIGGITDGSSEPADMVESRLIEGATSPGGLATVNQSEYFYAVFGDDINIQPTPTQPLNPGMRAWGVRDPGPMMLDTLGSGGVVDASNFKFQSMDAPAEDSIMVGTHVYVVAGAGINQRRKITAYVGATKQATVDTAFSPVLDATSKIATESRIVRMFHDILALGGAIRGKIVLQEDAAGLAAIKASRMEVFEDFIYRARTYAQRSPAMVDYDVI